MPTIARLCVDAKDTKMFGNRHDSYLHAPNCQWGDKHYSNQSQINLNVVLPW